MKHETLQQFVSDARKIVFFGGAGVSTESGIPDFRSVDGLYNQKYDYPPEQILSHTFFEHYPEEFFRFYRDKMLPLDAKPNAAHLKLAEWEAAGRMTGVVTQNIDGLHQAAGSRKVFELHGSIHRNYCMNAGNSIPRNISGTAVTRCLAAAAAGASNRMLSSTRKAWTMMWFPAPSVPLPLPI